LGPAEDQNLVVVGRWTVNKIITAALLLAATALCADDLSSLQKKYASVKTIRFVTVAQTQEMTQGKFATGTFTFAYAADNTTGSYHYSCQSDGKFSDRNASDLEAAWDGKTFATVRGDLRGDGSELHVGSVELMTDHESACINQFFLPLEHLVPKDDEPSFKAVTVQGNTKRVAGALVAKPDAARTYQLTTKKVRGGVTVVTESYMRTKEGTRYVSFDYDENSPTPWIPKGGQITGYDPSGKVVGRYAWKVTAFEIDQPLPIDMFQLDAKFNPDGSKRSRVFDEDIKAYIEHPDDRVRDKNIDDLVRERSAVQDQIAP